MSKHNPSYEDITNLDPFKKSIMSPGGPDAINPIDAHVRVMPSGWNVFSSPTPGSTGASNAIRTWEKYGTKYAAESATEFSPGVRGIDSVLRVLERKGGSASTIGLRVTPLEAAKGGLSVQLQIADELIDLPFEFRRGAVSMSGGVWGARGLLRADNTTATFSQAFADAIEQNVPVNSYNPSEVAKGIRRAIDTVGRENARDGSRTGLGMLRTIMVGGQPEVSRIPFFSSQVAISPEHPIGQAFQELAELQRVLTMNAGGTTTLHAARYRDKLEEVTRLMMKRGLTFHGIKASHVSSGLGIGALPESSLHAMGLASIYPGLDYADKKKGVHQLAKRFLLGPDARWAGLQKVPLLSATGTKQAFEMPIRLGLIDDPLLRHHLFFDSASFVTSGRLFDLVARNTNPEFLSVSTPIQLSRASGGVEVRELARSFSDDLLAQMPELQNLSHGETIKFDKLIQLKKGARKSGGKSGLIGTSIGRTGAGELARGDPIRLPKGYGISSVTLQQVRGEARYKFGIEKIGPGTVLGRGLLVSGTSRTSIARGVSVSGIDLLAATSDVMKDKLSTQTTVASQWLSHARRMGIHDEVAEAMGLTPGKIGKYTTAFGGHGFNLDEQAYDRVKNIFEKKLHQEGLGKKHLDYRLEGILKGTKEKFTRTEAVALVDAAGLDLTSREGRVLYERILSKGYRKYEGAPIAIRSGVGLGLTNRRGMTLRLDDLMMTLQRMGGDAETNKAVKGQYNDMLAMLRESRSGQTLREVGGLYGGVFGDLSSGVSVSNLNEYADKFAAVPNLKGGASTVAGSIVDPEFAGRRIKLPFEIDVLVGGETAWNRGQYDAVTTSEISLVSGDIHRFGTDPTGIYNSNEFSAAATKMDQALRSGDRAKIESAYREYTQVAKGMLWGKAGRMKPGVVPAASTFSRLEPLGGSIDDVLTVGMTESKLRAMAGKDMADEAVRRAKAGKLYMMGATQPQHQFMHHTPAMKVRLLKQQELIQGLGILKANTDDVLFASRDLMHIWRRDADLDTIFATLMMGKGQQKRAAVLHSSESAYHRFVFKQLDQSARKAVRDPALRTGNVIRSMLSASEDSAGQAFVDLVEGGQAVSVPHTFFRTRRQIAILSSLTHSVDAGIAARARKQLESIGLRNPSILNLSAKGATAAEVAEQAMKASRLYDVMSGMVRQEGISAMKHEGSATSIMQDILDARNNVISESELEKRLSGFFNKVIDSGSPPKFMRAMGIEKMAAFAEASDQTIGELMAQDLVKPILAVERSIAAQMGSDGGIWESAVTGRNKEPSVSRVARFLGAMFDTDVQVDPDLIHQRPDLVPVSSASNAAEALAAENRAVIEEAASVGTLRTEAKALLSNMWRGHTRIGGWGKAVIIGAGALAVKGLSDALAGSDDGMAGSPLPPTPIVPESQPLPPQFALTQDYTRLQRPMGRRILLRGTAQDVETYLPVAESVLGNTYGSINRLGHITNSSRGMRREEVASLLREQMRSDF